MMGSGGFIAYDEDPVSYVTPGTSPVFIIMKAADNVRLAVKVPVGWKKYCIDWSMVMAK
jgi:hypothetical protein